MSGGVGGGRLGRPPIPIDAASRAGPAGGPMSPNKLPVLRQSVLD